MAEQGWYADPMGRHELRWWDGSSWTEHVADAGVTSSEPVDAGGGPASAGPSHGASAAATGASSVGTTSAASTGASSVPPMTYGGAAASGPTAYAGGGAGSSGGWPTSAKVTVAVVAIGGLVVGGVGGFVAGVASNVVDEVGDGLQDGFGDSPPAVPGETLTSGGTRVVSGEASEPIEFPVVVSSGGQLRATVTSADFDTVLELRSPDGTVVASDDDSGSGTLSDLRVEVSPGSYTLVLDEWFGFDDGGAYTMEVVVP